MSNILYSYKCPVTGCTQVITVESNDETDALPHLLPAVQEHITSTHAGVPIPGNLGDLVRTGMYQGGSGGSSGEPTETTQSSGVSGDLPAETATPAAPTGEPTVTDTSTMPGVEPSMPGNAMPGSDASSGTYAPNPTVEPPATSEPMVNPPTMPSQEPQGGEMQPEATQPEVPEETPAQSVQAAEDGQSSQ